MHDKVYDRFLIITKFVKSCNFFSYNSIGK